MAIIRIFRNGTLVATDPNGPDSGAHNVTVPESASQGWASGVYDITCTSERSGFSESSASTAVQLPVSVPSGAALVGGTAVQNTVAGATATVTVPSIPSGALVMLLSATPGYAEAPMAVATSTSLTFTHRRWFRDGGGGGSFECLTAVAGSALSNEQITLTTGSATRAICVTALVFTGANTSTFAFTDLGSQLDSTTVTASHVVTGVSSIVVATLRSYPEGGDATGTLTFAPGAGTSEVAESPNVQNADGFLRSNQWVARVSGIVSAPATATVNGTLSAARSYAGMLVEVLSA